MRFIKLRWETIARSFSLSKAAISISNDGHWVTFLYSLWALGLMLVSHTTSITDICNLSTTSRICSLSCPLNVVLFLRALAVGHAVDALLLYLHHLYDSHVALLLFKVSSFCFLSILTKLYRTSLPCNLSDFIKSDVSSLSVVARASLLLELQMTIA